VPERSRWHQHRAIVMGGAKPNHRAMVRQSTHSTSHSTSHSNTHRRARRDDLRFDHPLRKGLRASATHSNTHSTSHSTSHSNTHSNTHRPSSQPCEVKGAVGATRLGIGLSAGTEEAVHAFRDHRAVVTFGVLWAKAHNDPRRRYGSQL
jgi:hypothetical protein